MNRILFILFFMILSGVVSAKEYHVSKKGDDKNPGTIDQPFLTINQAGKAAFPGDVITVHEGVYREWVNPPRGGKSETQRITYRAASNEKVEIKGSEKIDGWKNVKGTVWKVTIDNKIFGDYNPYQDSIYGDWFYRKGRIHHTGEVFLNEKSLYEKEILDKVFNPQADIILNDPEGSTYTWYCESNEKETTIWANFHQFNPNKELVEISTRPTCFYPTNQGVNYITISGFHVSQAATQWGAPTAEQVGMIATHWNKGWIIENNVISNSKCSGITLGKERGTGHNVWSEDKGNVNRDGNIHYIEVVFKTLRNGWNKQQVGSHIVRNNTIFNCEQTGICGSMGAAFSLIENNHIYNIWTKRQFNGAEIGGIKFHAAIDATIRKNRIHDTGRGLWLDWMTQGTRVSANLFYRNDLEDIFLEVNHGPFMVDNNILLSGSAIKTQSEGGAFVHNLVCGTVHMWPEPNRFTPYHLPHSTEVAGLTTIYSGDDRYLNNIFVGVGNAANVNQKANIGMGIYDNAKLPVFISNNVYYFGAKPGKNDQKFTVTEAWNPGVTIQEEGQNVYLSCSFGNEIDDKGLFVNTEVLGKAKIPKQAFENPDGSPISIDTDFFGKKRDAATPDIGPFENQNAGKNQIKVW